MWRWALAVSLFVLYVASVVSGEGLRTDESKALVPLNEIIAGGPPPDGIPAIDCPAFVTPDQAAWLKAQEPVLRPFLFNGRPDTRRPPKERVVGVKIGETAKAYPWPVLAEQRVIHDRV